MQIMIINIDAFNKKENNIIHDARDQMGGRKPIEFIQTTNPIVILDEPQNMESDKAKEAITSLNPLCYSPLFSDSPRSLQSYLPSWSGPGIPNESRQKDLDCLCSRGK